MEDVSIIDRGQANSDELRTLLQRIADAAGSAAICETCWVENCNAPFVAILKNAKGGVALLCKRHLRRLKQGKDRQVRFLSFRPAEQGSRATVRGAESNA